MPVPEGELRLGTPAMQFYYVYLLQSQAVLDRYYTGFTEDLKERLIKHNEGGVPHTAKFRPWRVKSAVAFADPFCIHAITTPYSWRENDC